MLRSNAYGIEEVVAEDRAYAGSRFSEVREAVFARPYEKLPTYAVTLGRMLHGLLPFGKRYAFRQASARAIDSHADLRWGPDRRGFRRLVHPNGICLSGRWEITEPTEYSGYFKQGSQALVLGRYSTCCTETRRGHSRSLALVVKLFPTIDAQHPNPLLPASLITQQDLGGEYSRYINDAVLTNAPNTTSFRRGSGLAVLMVTGAVFNFVDREPAIRQLYEIAELGKPIDEPTRSPAFLRLLVAADQPRIDGDELDFRHEIMAQLFDPGNPLPVRRLTFNVEVTDTGETHGPPVYQQRVFRNWRRIGTLTFDDAVASYNGDFVIHFHHPTWRRNRNDPSTSTRVGERKRT